MFFANNSPILHDFHAVVQDSYAILDFWCSKPTSFCDFGVSFLHQYCYLFGHGVGFLHHFGFLVQQTYVTLPFWCMIPTPSFFIGQCFWCKNFFLIRLVCRTVPAVKKIPCHGNNPVKSTIPVNGSSSAFLLCLIQIRKGAQAYVKPEISKSNSSNYRQQGNPTMAEVHPDSGGSISLLHDDT